MKITSHIIHLFLFILCLFTFSCQYNSDGREELRLGNRKYNKKLYVDAENNYLKSIEKEKSIEAYYGAGNAVQRQRIPSESDQLEKMDSLATSFYEEALSSNSGNNQKKSKLYHNLGNLKYLEGLKSQKIQKTEESNKQFNDAVENYKNSLRLNPDDDETRYNLALALFMLEKNKEEQKKQNRDNNNQDKNKNEEKDSNKQENQSNQDKEQKNKENNDNENNTPEGQNKNMEENRVTIDKKTANKLLNAAQRDENEVLKKVEKSIISGTNSEKDW